jgi:MFS transporter, CP family, cyanate transporter
VRAWRLGFLIGAGSLVFFGMNGWIASYNLAVRRTAPMPAVLLALNAAQPPVSFALTPFAQQLAGRRWPFVAADTLCVIATVGWLGGPAQAEPF